MIKLRRISAIACAIVLAMTLLIGCGPVTPTPKVNSPGIALELDAPVGEEGRGEVLNRPVASKISADESKTANVFISGERSMMGFADWQYDTVYETAVSLLTDELSGLSPAFYRYDAYDIDAVNMKISDAAELRANIRNINFYVSEPLGKESGIPVSVTQYRNDNLDALVEFVPWVSATVLENAGAPKAYPLENALKNFDRTALNVVVTDMYELRNGGFESLAMLKDYDIGILAIQSEYSGVLPKFSSDGADLIWGSPTTGAYKGETVKTVRYTREDGTAASYKYNLFAAYTESERVSEMRTFYILFAGNGTQIAEVMNGLSMKISTRYANSTMINPEIDSLLLKNGFFSAVFENEKTITGGAIEYIELPFGEGYTDAYGFEIRAADEVPKLVVQAEFPTETGASARTLIASDFKVSSKCISISGGGRDFDTAQPKLTLDNAGAGATLVQLTYETDELPVGEYVFETHVFITPPEQGKDEAEFLAKWGVEVDDGSLRQWLLSYNAGEQDGIDKMRSLMVRTLGLSNITAPISTDSAEREVFAVRVYFNVV